MRTLLVAFVSVLGLLLVYTALDRPHIPALTKTLYFPLYLYASTPILMLVYTRFVALCSTYSRELRALGKLRRATIKEALGTSSRFK